MLKHRYLKEIYMFFIYFNSFLEYFKEEFSKLTLKEKISFKFIEKLGGIIENAVKKETT